MKGKRSEKTLTEQVDVSIQLERQKAIRAILLKPLLTSNSKEFPLIRKHANWIREWFLRHPGWTFHIDAEIARLKKVPPQPIHGTYPAIEPKDGVPFNRLTYIIFCLALAFLERAERQTTLGMIAQAIVHSFHEEPLFAAEGFRFDLLEREDRKTLVQVIRFLIEWGILTKVQGDEELYIGNNDQDDRRRDALYNIRRGALANVLSVKRGPSTFNPATGTDSSSYLEKRIQAVIEEVYPDNEDGKNRFIRSKLNRLLLNEPVIYFSEMSTEEVAYFQSQKSFVLQQIRNATGLVPEIRAEGIALVDEYGELSDVWMPDEGTEGHITLLLAGYLGMCMKQREFCCPETKGIFQEKLERKVKDFRVEFGKYWKKAAKMEGSERPLTEAALRRLEALRLIQRIKDRIIVPFPAIARYSVTAPRVTKFQSIRPFKEEEFYEITAPTFDF